MYEEYQRKQFTFYASYYRALRALPQEQRLAAYDAVLDYVFLGVEPALAEGAFAAFALIQPFLDTALVRSRKARQSKEQEQEKEQDKEQEKEQGKEQEKDKEQDKEKDKEEAQAAACGVCSGEALDASAWSGEGFARFWEAYPRKLEREAAHSAWRARIHGEAQARQVLDTLGAWNASPNWAAEGGRYIPKPAAFLRDSRYAAPPNTRAAKRTLDDDERAAILRMMRED